MLVGCHRADLTAPDGSLAFETHQPSILSGPCLFVCFFLSRFRFHDPSEVGHLVGEPGEGAGNFTRPDASVGLRGGRSAGSLRVV